MLRSFPLTRCLIGFFALTIGCPASQPVVQDNFEAAAINPARWTPFNDAGGSISLATGGDGNRRLQFVVGSPGEDGDTGALRLATDLRPLANNRRWSAVVDLENHTNPSGDQFAGAGIQVTNAADPGDYALIEFYASADGRGIVSDFSRNGTDVFGPDLPLSSAKKQVSIKVSYLYDSGTRRLEFFYDDNGPQNGYLWTRLASWDLTATSTSWALSDTSRFALEIYGYSEGIPIPAGQVTLDNFELMPSEVQRLGINKRRIQRQTEAGSLVDGNYSIEAFIEGECIVATYPPGPNRIEGMDSAGGTLLYDDERWAFEADFPTRDALEAAFPNLPNSADGYFFHVAGRTLPLPVVLAADAYPAQPVVTASAGTWAGGKLYLTPQQAQAGFTLTTNSVAANGYLSLEIYTPSSDVYSKGSSYTGQASRVLSAAVPANRLMQGNTYTVEVEFDSVPHWSSMISTPVWAAPLCDIFGIYSSRTTFEIIVGNPPADPFTEAMNAAGLTGANAAADAAPFGDGEKNLLKYAFNMNLAAADARIMAAGGTAGLPSFTLHGQGAGTVLRCEFVHRLNGGLNYTPQKSANPGQPGSWTPFTASPVRTGIDAEWERVRYDEPCDPATNPACFGRVQVALP